MRKPLKIVAAMAICLFAWVDGLHAEVVVVTVKVPKANIRSVPALSGKVITQAENGQKFESHSKEGEWYRVSLSQESVAASFGYIHASVVEVSKPLPSQISFSDQEKASEKPIQAQVAESEYDEVRWIVGSRSDQVNTSSTKTGAAWKSTGGQGQKATAASGAPSESYAVLQIGANAPRLSGDGKQPEFRVTPHVGLGLQIAVGKLFQIESGVVFSKHGDLQESRYGEVIYKYKTNISYLEVPLRFRVTTPLDSKIMPYFFFGPSFGLNIGDSFTITRVVDGEVTDKEKMKITFRSIDVPVTGGVGLDYQLNEQSRLTFSFQYRVGLIALYEGGSTKARTWSLLLGYGLKIR